MNTATTKLDTEMKTELDAPEILSRAVHDLNNPLAVIRATLDWLETDLAPLTADRADALRDVSTATARLASIIADVHTLARMARGEEGDRVEVDLAVLVLKTVEDAEPRAKARGVSIAAVSVPCTVHVEEAAFGRALTTLVDLALREAPPGTTVQVSVTCQDGSAKLVLGDGSEASSGRTRRELGGSGISALVATEVVRAQGGKLTVTNGEKMARIAVELPLP